MGVSSARTRWLSRTSWRIRSTSGCSTSLTVRRSHGRETTKAGKQVALPIAEELAHFLAAVMAVSPGPYVCPAPDGGRMGEHFDLEGRLRRVMASAGVGVIGYRQHCRGKRCGWVVHTSEARSQPCPQHGLDHLLVSAEVRPVGFHDLRRSHASLLAAAGASTSVTQRLMRHSDPKLTEAIYTQVDLSTLAEGVNRLRFGIAGTNTAQTVCQGRPQASNSTASAEAFANTSETLGAMTPARFERATCGLGNRRSIHLSYGAGTSIITRTYKMLTCVGRPETALWQWIQSTQIPIKYPIGAVLSHGKCSFNGRHHLVGTWKGGRIQRLKDGSNRFVLRRMVGGRRYSLSLDARDEEEAPPSTSQSAELHALAAHSWRGPAARLQPAFHWPGRRLFQIHGPHQLLPALSVVVRRRSLEGHDAFESWNNNFPKARRLQRAGRAKAQCSDKRGEAAWVLLEALDGSVGRAGGGRPRGGP
jgi:hypothetical protein